MIKYLFIENLSLIFNSVYVLTSTSSDHFEIFFCTSYQFFGKTSNNNMKIIILLLIYFSRGFLAGLFIKIIHNEKIAPLTLFSRGKR